MNPVLRTPLVVGRSTLEDALTHHLQEAPADRQSALRDTVLALAQACAEVADVASLGVLSGSHGPAASSNSQGEAQQKLDVLADACLSRHLAACRHVAAWASEEQEAATASPRHATRGTLLVAFDPLDGSSNVEANIGIGTIFSVLPHRQPGCEPADPAFFQDGHQQLAAGYVLYGPATLLVLTVRRGVLMFTLDRRDPGRPCWTLTQDPVAVPAHTREFAINASNQRFWDKPVQRYVAECLAGEGGPRQKDFNLRWLASLVAEAHRIFTRGGVFLYPCDAREAYRQGRLRLLYEAAPMALLMEQAGGRASTGDTDLLSLVPRSLHQRVPVMLGSREEIERLHTCHTDPHDTVAWQLFKTRSLFVQPQP